MLLCLLLCPAAPVCLGHLFQVLAQALGGSVGPNPDGNFVLTVDQIVPAVQSLQQYKQLGSVLHAALAATTTAAAPPVCPADAAAAQHGAAAAVAAAVAATVNQVVACSVGTADSSSSSRSCDVGTGSNGSSSARYSAVTEQLSGLRLGGATGSSSNGGAGGSSGSHDGSSDCKSGGCFQLIESHGDQVRA